MKSERCSQVDLLNTHTYTQRGGKGEGERERAGEGSLWVNQNIKGGGHVGLPVTLKD